MDHQYAMEKSFLNRCDIEEKIMPFFFSSGKMESQKIVYSRWSKAIKKTVLLPILEQLDESISIGEDTLTSFLTFLNANSVYNIDDGILYHYMRRNNTMCGNYGVEFAQKLVAARNALIRVAQDYHYAYTESIENYLLDNILITIKKVLTNKNYTMKEKQETMDRIFQIPEVRACMENSSVYAKSYHWKHKLFIKLVKMGRIRK
jgi:hypothetical protein